MNLKPVIGLFVACATLGASEISAIWPDGKMPGKATDKKEWAKVGDTWIGKKDKVLMIGDVSKPTIELFKADTKTPAGFVVVCPGGGYGIVAYEHEGTEIAQWLNKQGVSAMVLKYRVPNNPEGALMDAQRAVRLARANAEKWNINPNKIAIMGFSAGASLSARASTRYNEKLYAPIDGADLLSARPDATILIYPAYCDEAGNNKRWNKSDSEQRHDYNGMYRITGDLPVTKDTPPAFIVQTLDDGLVNSAISYFLALKERKIPASVHIFQSGGHGYALRKLDKPIDEWEDLLESWLEANNFTAELKK